MKKQVLVAGGGIGGLAAALGASRAGWEVRLYERAAAFSEVGAGVQIGPNVVRRLQAWGLQKALQTVAAFPSALVSRNAVNGEVLAQLELGADAVLVNTAIAVAGDPVAMGRAFSLAVTAGRMAYENGLGAAGAYGEATSPLSAFLATLDEESR